MGNLLNLSGWRGILTLSAVAALLYLWQQGNTSTYDVAGRETPLIEAARTGEPDLVERALADGADPNQVDSIIGRTPLHWATSLESGLAYPGRIQQRLAIVQALVRKGADPARKDNSQETPLYRAVWNPELVEALLKVGAPVDDGLAGQTPLMSATYLGGKLCFAAADSMRVLIKAGANPNAQVQGTKWTALLTAARYGCPDMVEALLEAHADPNATTNMGETVLGALARIEKMESSEPSGWLATGPDRELYARSKELIRKAGGRE